ncbi:MAG TPA: glycoside hydrolase family 97 catalytic domain-containing protein [bacterium]|nr:glycoside hydrolase family 97 catalytic domain-containing protein [bacterium]
MDNRTEARVRRMSEILKRVVLPVLAGLVMCAGMCVAEPVIELSNPAGTLGMSVFTDAGGRLSYRVSAGGAAIIDASALGVVVDGVDYGAGAVIGVPEYGKRSERFATRLNHTAGGIECNTLLLPVSASGRGMSLDVVCCDTGVAYRYIVPGDGKRKITGEAGEWRIPAGATLWYQPGTASYEKDYRKADSVDEGVQIGPPLIAVYDNGYYAAITESSLMDYSGMTLRAGGSNVFAAEFLDDPGGWAVEGEVRTPWRVTIISEGLDGLVNSDLVEGLSAPAATGLADADWIRPGRALWSWLNGAVDSVTPENMRKYIDEAAELGFEYVLVDAGWEATPEYWRNPPGWSYEGKTPEQLIKELVDYGAAKGVGIWVWKHYSKLADPEYRREYMDRLSGLGVAGIKIDFMDSESQEMVRFYEGCLRDAAARKLMINFHGANKPAGESRTFPNEVAREGIRGLETRTMTLSHVTALPFTRLTAGHADYTPMHFQREWMSGTTWPHQLASGIIFTTPVTFFGGDPRDYLDSPAVELIREIAPVWDETVVLEQSRIGRLAAFARRAGDMWFIAMMNGGASMKFKLPLDFLGSGEYRIVAFMDDRDSLSMKKVETKVTKKDSVPVKMKSLGGFAAMLVPVEGE